MNAPRLPLSRLLALCCLALAAACAKPASTSSSDSQLEAAPDSPAKFSRVGDFAFSERSGRTVGSAELLGEVWVVGFFFTRCAGPCPKLSANMQGAQEQLAESGVKLVSISVDPNFDTPEILAEYAERFSADADRWLFLSGPEQATYDLMQDSFFLGVSTDMDEIAALRVTHATKLVVVDREGSIRGYYDGESEEGVAGAVARARWLDAHDTRDAAGNERSRLPLLNACLNGTAALLLLAGIVAIKRGAKVAHANLMRGAFLVSAAFLTSYLYYHFVVVPAQGGTVPYNGAGALRGIYFFAILIPHIIGAIINLPMVLGTLWFAHKERWEAHKRLARWTFPLWLYVSVSGVAVYLMLYPFNPPAQ
jgi:protein SCO1